MASRGKREKELRRRPVHGEANVPDVEREVEISEIAEDDEEQDYADDPLILKGSRPTAPPQKLADGTEVSVHPIPAGPSSFTTIHSTRKTGGSMTTTIGAGRPGNRDVPLSDKRTG